MITLYPLQYNKFKNYYTNINFTIDENTTTMYLKGSFANKYINKSITIDKNRLNLSTTVINSIPSKYTYLLVDLYSYTYASNNAPFNSNEPHKPEFLLYLDTNLNIINNTYSLVTNSVAPTTIIPIENLEISPFMIPHSKIYVGTSYPTSPNEYNSFYNTDTKELFVYLSNSWRRINWQKIIQSDRLFEEGRLRINTSTGDLEIMSSNTTWYKIVPTIGAVFTPVSYTGYVYYIAPGQTYNGFRSSIAPIIAVNGMMYKSVYWHNYSGQTWFGIFPSGLAIGDGAGAFLAGDTSTTARNTNYKKFVPILDQSDANKNWANISIHITSNIMFTTGIGYGNSSIQVITCIGFGSFPTSGYYLGIWCYEDTSITVDMVSIKREM